MGSKEFSRKTFLWLYQVNHDPDLPLACTNVALELTVYFTENDDGGRAFPGYQRIAEAIGVAHSTVERSIKLMHDRGHLRVLWGSRGSRHSNQYWMILKTPPAGVLDQIKTPPAGVSDDIKTPPVGVLTGEETPFGTGENPYSKSENPRQQGLKLPPAGMNHKTNHKSNHRGKPHASDGPPVSISISDQQEENDFERFSATYPKQINKAAAKREWPVARQKVSAEEIIAGAVRYANDPTRLAQSRGRHGDRFTVFPATWLKDERWTDKIQTGDVIDEHGNLIAVQMEEEDDDVIAWAERT